MLSKHVPYILMNSPINNIANCVFIGNTASIDEQILFNYCSQYGPILSCSIGSCPWEKRFFCDFRIVQYMNSEHMKNFLLKPYHRIGDKNLQVKHYKDLLKNVDLLNMDRKLFVGPLGQHHFINQIIEFYRKIDPNLQCCISLQYQQTYLLFEFSNRQYIRNVLERQIVPRSFDNQPITIHPAVNPIESIRKNISSKNVSCQILVRGLKERINERILTDYFEKRVSIVACHISPIDSTCALIELENEYYVNRLLEMSSIRLNGILLSLYKASTCSSSLSSLFPTENTRYDDNEIDRLLEATGPPSITSRPLSSLANASPVPRVNASVVHQPPTPPVNHPSQSVGSTIFEITECGWSSPPRSISHQHSSIDRSSAYVPSQPTLTIADVNRCSSSNSTVEIKPTVPSEKNISKFVEEFITELDQIKDDYRKKFAENQRIIENEFHQLITNERNALKKFERDICERRRQHSKETNKRKHHRSSS